MAVENITKYILEEAEKKRTALIKEAEEKKEEILKKAHQEAKLIYDEMIKKAKYEIENENRKILSNAKVEERKKILEFKQNAINSVFKKLKEILKDKKPKKIKVFYDHIEETEADIDFYIKSIQSEYQDKIAKILFE